MSLRSSIEKSVIHLFQKWRPINNSFVFMKISLTSLVSMCEIQQNFYCKMKVVGLLNRLKRIINRSPFLKRSIFDCLHLKLSYYSVSIFCCLGFSSSEGEGGYEVIEALKFWLVFQLVRIYLKKNKKKYKQRVMTLLK